MITIREQDKQLFDTRHGGPFDRGSADSWYSRGRDPHMYAGDTSMSPRIEADKMQATEIAAYNAGYNWNEKFGGKKSWD